MNYAVLEGKDVINTIVADSLEIAQEITGKTCVEYSDTEFAEPGGTYENKKFIQRQPFPSWTLDSKKKWQPPTPYPNDEFFYVWSEETVSWQKQETIEEES